jgi:DNA-binding PadR family transcriptional regulator
MKADLSRRAAAHIPLKPAEFQVLLTLAERPQTGYGIRRSVEERTGGAVRLWPASLYRTLGQLLDDRLIEETDEVEAPDDAVDRRFYALTALGQAVLAAETDRLEELVRLARAAQARPREA